MNVGETGNSERKHTLKPGLWVQAATPLRCCLPSVPQPRTVRSSHPNPSRTWEPATEGAGGPASLALVSGQQQAVTRARSRERDTGMILHPEKSQGTGTLLALGRRCLEQSSRLTRAGQSQGGKRSCGEL